MTPLEPTTTELQHEILAENCKIIYACSTAVVQSDEGGAHYSGDYLFHR